MTTSRAIAKLLALALSAGAAGGCPFGECYTENLSVPPGDAAPGGIDPRPALDALPPQTIPLRWAQIDEVTTLTITTAAAAGQPSVARTGCSGGAPFGYQVPGEITLQTADGRLHATAATLPVNVDAAGKLVTPAWVSATLPAYIFVGTGVASDTLLQTGSGDVQISIDLVSAGAGVAYGKGSLVLSGGDSIHLAEIGASP